ncbi:MAG: hypothetical protein GX847_08685, partial [Clostridiales bacterium]|nr:hypothetical protein [Clostridiales bacterium]
MKKLKMVVLLALVLVMAASLLSGCAPKQTSGETPSAAPSAGASGTRTEPASDPNHAVYTLMESNMVPWQGVDTTETASRAAIEKAIKPDNRADGITVGYVTWNNSTPFFAASE